MTWSTIEAVISYKAAASHNLGSKRLGPWGIHFASRSTYYMTFYDRHSNKAMYSSTQSIIEDHYSNFIAKRPTVLAGSESHTWEGATIPKSVSKSDAFCNSAKSSGCAL